MPNDRPIRRGDGFVETRQRQRGPVYVARWHDGDRWRAKTFADEDDAYDHLRAQGRKRRRGQSTAVSDLTVAELLDDYLDRGRHRWTANTVATYRLIVARHIVPHLGGVRIVDLTPAQVQRWIDRRTGQVSASVLQSARTILSGAFRDAVRLGQVATNPVTGTHAPARRHVQRATWDAGDIRAVLATVAGDVLMHAWYLVALTTGMRPGEVRALMWEDIDFDRGIITVRRTMTRDEDFRHTVGTTTKTRRGRSVAIPAVTVTALAAHRDDQRQRQAVAPAWADRGLVFDRGDGNPLAQQTISNRHRAICDRAQVPRIRQHDIRHSAATMMLRSGVSPKIVADILGHASITTTLDIYSHVDVDMQRAAIASITSAIDDAVRIAVRNDPDADADEGD